MHLFYVGMPSPAFPPHNTSEENMTSSYVTITNTITDDTVYINVLSDACYSYRQHVNQKHVHTFELALKSLHIFNINLNTGKMESFLFNSIFQLCTAYDTLHQLGRLYVYAHSKTTIITI